MASNTLDAMRKQESGVVIDELEKAQDLPRAELDVDFNDDNISKHCVCQIIDDSLMIPCDACGDLYHP